MKIDAYTRIVLTVIAGCLVYFVARDLTLVPDARAQEAGAVTPVNVVQIAGAPIDAPRDTRAEVSLPVRVLD